MYKPIDRFKITEKEKLFHEQLDSCTKACKEIVRQVVHEYEESNRHAKHWWNIVLEKRGYNSRAHVATLEGDEIIVYDKTDYEVKRVMDSVGNDIELRKRIKRELSD